MQGTLFRYGNANEHIAFISGRHRQHVLLIAGLTEGLLGCSYAEELSSKLDKIGFSLVQVQLTSSYRGYGISCLDQDSKELLLLTRYLQKEYQSSGLVIVGYSTGCQIIVRYMQMEQVKKANDVNVFQECSCDVVSCRCWSLPPPVLGTVLQAPVSDREYLTGLEGIAESVIKAEAMVANGDGEDICLRWSLDDAPMTAKRLLSLCQRLGDDDMFSSDLSDAELAATLRDVGTRPCLILASGADEYVPDTVNISGQASRLAMAIGPLTQVTVIADACHSLAGHEEEAVRHIINFVIGISGEGPCVP